MIIIDVWLSSIRCRRTWRRRRRRRFLLWRLNRRRDLCWSGCRLNSILFRENVIPDPTEHALDAGKVTLAVVQRRVDVVKPGMKEKFCNTNFSKEQFHNYLRIFSFFSTISHSQICWTRHSNSNPLKLECDVINEGSFWEQFNYYLWVKSVPWFCCQKLFLLTIKLLGSRKSNFLGFEQKTD